eukprot:73030-Rhodomonas_salina.1
MSTVEVLAVSGPGLGVRELSAGGNGRHAADGSALEGRGARGEQRAEGSLSPGSTARARDACPHAVPAPDNAVDAHTRALRRSVSVLGNQTR